jgi:mRNA-degrading endonuclease RelE of RelBE toxin-antitoxin system
MAWRIAITDEADSQLRALPVREQRIVEAAVTARLREHPTTPTKAIRRLRPNALADFELRVRDLRILYNVERQTSEVVLLIVGRKVGNKLIVGGEEFHGHRGDPPESTADGRTGPADQVL